MQHYGTDKVGWLFAPIVLIWFLFIGATGIYNICKHDTSVLKAFSPKYIYLYFKRRGRDGWISLGGILLSITGKSSFKEIFLELSLKCFNRYKVSHRKLEAIFKMFPLKKL